MASLDNSREQKHTYLKKQTASDGRLLSMAKKVERIGNLASAFDQLIGSGQRDEYAIALLAAFHASSSGQDSVSSPAYEPPDGLSPLATWRGGPAGGSTVLEMASLVISNPSDVDIQRAFKEGLRDQLSVIKRLYEASGDAGFTELKRFVVQEPLAVRDRLLAVYNVLFEAMTIVDDAAAARASGFRQPYLDGQSTDEAVQAEAPTVITEQFIDKLINKGLNDKLLQILNPLAEGFSEDHDRVLSELREVSSHSKMLEAKLFDLAASNLAPNDDKNDKMLQRVTELEGKLAEATSERDNHVGAFAAELAKLKADNTRLEAEVKAKDGKVSPGCETPVSGATNLLLLRKLTDLEGKLTPNPAGKGDGDSGLHSDELEKLKLENAKLMAEAKASNPKAAFTPDHPGLGERSSLNDFGQSPYTNPPGKPSFSLPAWAYIPQPVGLEGAPLPNYAEAWSARPAEGEIGKTARKQFVMALQPEKLLDTLPPAGDATAYGVIRHRLFENFMLFSEYIQGGGAGGEAALLRALTGCAGAKYKTSAQAEPHWRGLMASTSVMEFLKKLDGTYADRNHTASEKEWVEAKTLATDALDYFERLRHLLGSGDARRRGRTLLVQYLAERGETYGMGELQKCSLDDLDAWHTVLDSLRSVKQQVSAAAPAVEHRRKAAALDQALAAFTKAKTSDEHTRYEHGSLYADTDTTLEESSVLLQKLLELRKKQQEQEESMKELRRQTLAAFDPAAKPNFGGGFRQEPPLVWNLQAIKEFTGTDKPVPERRGPHPNGTHGSECFACVGLDYKFDSHDALKDKGFPTGWRAYHNAWKCTKIPKYVEMEASKKGASREEVEKVLTMIPDPTWKPRGV